MNKKNSESAFRDALTFAKESFLKGEFFVLNFSAELDLAISFDNEKGHNVLNTNMKSSLVSYLVNSNIKEKDAWILVLRHEFGHMSLNSHCFNLNLDPTNANDQMSVIGIALTDSQKKWIPDFHKESAIEAYCDAQMLVYAHNHYPEHWGVICQTLLKFRTKNSSVFTRNPAFQNYGDEYFCSAPIEQSLKDGLPIEPLYAAKIAFVSSIKNAPLHMEIVNAIQISIDSLFEQLKPNHPSLARIISTSTNASLGRLGAGIDNFRNNKQTLKKEQKVSNSSKPQTPKL